MASAMRDKQLIDTALAGIGGALGNVFFVQSTQTGAADSAGRGLRPEEALLSINYAVGRCTANNGDVIVVMPGHVETVSAAPSGSHAAASGELNLDVAGITVLFVGNGSSRPLIKHTATGSITRINANGVTLVNAYLTGDIDAVANVLQVNGVTDVTLRNLTYRDVTGEATKFFHAANNSDRLTIDGVRVIGAATAGATHAMTFDGCDDLVIKGEIHIFGNYSTAAIGFITTLSARINIQPTACNIWNQNSADVCIVDTITGCTGNISGPMSLHLTDNAANITEAITGATFTLYDNIWVCNLAGEKAMLINWTASTDA